jgi:Novel STAND NTPase 1/WD domain, G-beta repeat
VTDMESAVRVSGEIQLDRNNPWPGLASYDESSFSFFSGRTAESAELFRRILDEPITVLFGKSGLGKTSLLKAGVFPRLRDRDLLPILIRLQLRAGADPLTAQVQRTLFDELRSQGIEHPGIRDGESFWEYLHRARLEFWTPQNRLVRPVFVFDQFEELFTLGRSMTADVQAFREDLADLAENRIPGAVAGRLEDGPAAEAGLDLQTMPYKIVIALREDFLADLEGWRVTIPSLRRNRMRLLPMGPEQAFQAVCNDRTRHLVSEVIGRKIVAFLSSPAGGADDDGRDDSALPTVEPALLSLFCRGVNEHRKLEIKTQFDDALLEGGKGTIVLDFYRTSLADQPVRVRTFIEEELITEHGYRNSYSVDDAIARNAVTARELETLINRHLLRHEHHLGADRVELTHDLLTRAVVEERDERRQAEQTVLDRRQRWRLIAIAAAFALVAVVFAGLALRASRAELRANAERDRARSRELGALAATVMNTDPELAAILALRGLDRAETAEARSALLDAAQYAWPSAILSKDAVRGMPKAVALSGDGNLLAVLAGSDTISLWDVRTREPSPVWKNPASLAASATVAFSPDQKLLAVGRLSSIELLDAATGLPARTLPPQPEVRDRRIAFSPDGDWLATSQDDDHVRLINYRDDSIQPIDIPASGVVGFSVISGKRILAVRDPLAAFAFELQDDGKWTQTKVDLSTCMNPQSVSPGPEFFSATWRAHACTFNASNGEPSNEGTADRATTDVVWSAGGGASAELLEPQERVSDLLVGRFLSGRMASRIKGAHISPFESDRSRLISMNEAATRAAVIDADETHTQVRIFSLGSHKLFLSRFDRDGFSVAPDGEWMAVATGSAKAPAIDIIPLKQTFDPRQLARVSLRIPTAAAPTRVYAVQNSVVAVLSTEPTTTVVFDAASGKPRFEPRTGRAEPIGRAGGVLLFRPSGTDPWRLVKTMDGTPLAVPDQFPVTRESLIVARSPRREAIAVMRPVSSGSHRAGVVLYSVQGDRVLPAGYLREPPEGLLSAEMMGVNDDASGITDVQKQLFWPAAKSADGAQAAATRVTPGSSSPSGRVVLQQDTRRVVRQPDGAVLKQFTGEIGGYLFSADDRWLAVWGKDGLHVLDLTTGQPSFGLNFGEDIETVEFGAHDSILSVHFSVTTLVVPLERRTIEQFARWLAPRELTNEERVMFGLRE